MCVKDGSGSPQRSEDYSGQPDPCGHAQTPLKPKHSQQINMVILKFSSDYYLILLTTLYSIS